MRVLHCITKGIGINQLLVQVMQKESGNNDN